VDRDEDVRTACFLALDVLRAQYGDELPYRGALDHGFSVGDRHVAFFTPMRGIYRAAVQRGPAALSISTSFKSPYNDQQTEDGFLYAYQAGPIDNSDNRALRAAHQLQVPIAYFWGGVRPGWYRPLYPWFVDQDLPTERRVLVSPSVEAGEIAVPLANPIQRRYAVREAKVRLHQGRFRGAVLLAYQDRCAICRLKEIRLLDAAHIMGDPEPTGTPEISNGLSLCSIHHRAFDHDLVGVAPDYQVHVSRRLLEEEDGPMLDVLKTSQGAMIDLPSRRAWHPDRDRLAARFVRFNAAA